MGRASLSFDKFAEQVSALIIAEPQFINALSAAFARTAYAIVPRQMDLTGACTSTPVSEPPNWYERKRGTNAVQFIKANYGEMRDGTWHHGGLARAELKKNPGLYNAYTAWIMYHPEDKLEFASGVTRIGRPPETNILTLADRYVQQRTRSREYKAERRGSKPCDGMTHGF